MPDASTGVVQDGRREPQTAALDIAGGHLVYYTAPAPDKTTENEDSLAAIPYGPEAAVLAVADGAGGMPGGRRASETALTVLEQSLQRSSEETLLLRTAILNGIEAANQAVIDLGNGSATTLTIVAIEGRTVRTYQVGDSEALVFGQRGRLRAQTTAHSPTGFAVEAGFLDQREALHHEERHLLSNFIGSGNMHIDVGATVDLNPRDTVLLASDGLTDNLHLEEIVETTRKGPLDVALDVVTRRAIRRMTVESKTYPSKPDDLSVLLFRKPAVGASKSGKD
ncbi:MAG: PP2C family serine/threonine-protein phosphatase [Woeseiaceae bacterium]|nr:PP2C family serine/threonine-protein phosphatase [Woeseiaceae bacterium]